MNSAENATASRRRLRLFQQGMARDGFNGDNLSRVRFPGELQFDVALNPCLHRERRDSRGADFSLRRRPHTLYRVVFCSLSVSELAPGFRSILTFQTR